MLIVGDREAESEAVSVRSRVEGDRGAIGLTVFMDALKEEEAAV